MANVQRGSATIYQFPAGGRAGLARAEAFRSAADSGAQIADVVWGESWYHEEAVREAAEQPRKN